MDGSAIDNDTPQTLESLKRTRILEGAMKVFLAYGFARTTMDDIARASDLSRPALYLLFKNKTDIYRAIAETLLRHSLDTARAALARNQPFARRMEAVADEALIALMQTFQQSAHGAEILDKKNSLAGDVVETWRNTMSDLLAAAIDEEAARAGTDLSTSRLSAAMLANLLLDGLEGMKMRNPDPDAQRDGARGLIRAVERILRP